MDDRARARDDVLSLRRVAQLALVISSGCAPAPPPPRPLQPPRAPGAPAVTPSPVPAAPGFPLLPDYATRLVKLGELVSRGHAGGRYHATLYANDAAARAWRSSAAKMPAGALLAAAHSDRQGPGPLLVMHKRSAGYDPDHGDWYYAVADRDARHVLRQGRLPDCAACHSTSPTAYVFVVGAPR